MGLDKAGLVRAEQTDAFSFGAGPAGQAGLAVGYPLEVLDATFEEDEATLTGGHGEGEEEATHATLRRRSLRRRNPRL